MVVLDNRKTAYLSFFPFSVAGVSSVQHAGLVRRRHIKPARHKVPSYTITTDPATTSAPDVELPLPATLPGYRSVIFHVTRADR